MEYWLKGKEGREEAAERAGGGGGGGGEEEGKTRKAEIAAIMGYSD